MTKWSTSFLLILISFIGLSQQDSTKQNVQKSILVLQLYQEENFQFNSIQKLLEQNEYQVNLFKNYPPHIQKFDSLLSHSSQFWLFSSCVKKLSNAHLKSIYKNALRGMNLLILAENEPFYADANVLSTHLLSCTFQGNIIGGEQAKVHPFELKENKPDSVYQGLTVSYLAENDSINPILTDDDGKIIIGSIEKQNFRAILDGGYSRYFIKQDKNSMQLLINFARWLEN